MFKHKHKVGSGGHGPAAPPCIYFWWLCCTRMTDKYQNISNIVFVNKIMCRYCSSMQRYENILHSNTINVDKMIESTHSYGKIFDIKVN